MILHKEQDHAIRQTPSVRCISFSSEIQTQVTDPHGMPVPTIIA
jgi:hypothetical protein